jgi:hypothetical protein
MRFAILAVPASPSPRTISTGRIDRAEAVELTRKYQLVSAARAEQSIAFTDQYRSYVINYGSARISSGPMSRAPGRILRRAGRRWKRSCPSRLCPGICGGEMRFWDERQRLHAPARELHNGAFVPYAEHGGRIDSMLAAIGATEPAADHGEAALLRVHPGDYLDFLKSAFDDWRSAGRPGDASGYIWPVVGRRPLDLDRIDARLGQYSYRRLDPDRRGDLGERLLVGADGAVGA